MKNFFFVFAMMTWGFWTAPDALAVDPPKMSNGYSVDLCLNWAANCGKPAADYYCKQLGYQAGSANFNWAYMHPTWVMGDNKVCNGAYCGGFTFIQCAGAKSGSGPKMSNGYSVDWCLNWATNCGKPAADSYCKLSGYPAGSASFTTGSMKPTWVMGDGKVCNDTYCVGFTSIQCAAGGVPNPGDPGLQSGGFINWDTRPQFEGLGSGTYKVGDRIRYTCGPMPSRAPGARIWGSGPYDISSFTCDAAVHAGVITPTGGSFTVTITGPQPVLPGSVQNGVESYPTGFAPRNGLTISR